MGAWLALRRKTCAYRSHGGVPVLFPGLALSHGASRDLGPVPISRPWAWGINGCASVIGAVLGKLISMSVGLRMTMLIAALLYLLSAAVFRFTLRQKREAR